MEGVGEVFKTKKRSVISLKNNSFAQLAAQVKLTKKESKQYSDRICT